MGDRYTLDRKCAYCGMLNKEIWYAPTSNSMTFKCKECKKDNFITIDLEVKKIEDVAFADVLNAISGASTMMDDAQIRNCAQEYYKNLKERLKEIENAKRKK